VKAGVTFAGCPPGQARNEPAGCTFDGSRFLVAGPPRCVSFKIWTSPRGAGRTDDVRGGPRDVRARLTGRRPGDTVKHGREPVRLLHRPGRLGPP
jgi:hypothetical protein